MTRTPHQKMMRRVRNDYQENFQKLPIHTKGSLAGHYLLELASTLDSNWNEEHDEMLFKVQLLIDDLSKLHTALEMQRRIREWRKRDANKMAKEAGQ